MSMCVCYLDCHEAGLCCYLVTHIENLLHPLQLFYFNLWTIYWLYPVHVGMAKFSFLFMKFSLYKNTFSFPLSYQVTDASSMKSFILIVYPVQDSAYEFIISLKFLSKQMKNTEDYVRWFTISQPTAANVAFV
jgi:hypothetical protein